MPSRAGRCRKACRWSPGEQHLAVHVEDHPLAYATFEGEIPAGNYGAGTVEIWDHGTYELVEEKPNGGLTVRLHGERLDGLWTLVPAQLGGDAKNWLIVSKKKDERAERRGGDRTYGPMLATLAADVPTRRGLALRGQVGRLPGDRDDPRRQRRPAEPERQDLRDRFPDGRQDAGARAPHTRLRGSTAKSCAVGEDGRATFSAMQQGKEGTTPLRTSLTCSRWRGRRSSTCRSTERHKRLAELRRRRAATVRISATFDDGPAFYAAAQEQRFEGIMAKRADSPTSPAGARATG